MSLPSWNIKDFFKSWKLPALVAVLEGVTHFGTLQGDSSHYIDIVKYLRGAGNSEIFQAHFILRPVVPALAFPLSFLVSYRSAIALVNLGFIVFGTVMTYFLGRELFDEEVGVISAISFACAVPVLAYGVAVLTDGAGYAMLVTLIYVAMFRIPAEKDLRRTFLFGLLFGVAVLTKETTFIGLVFLWIYYFANGRKLSVVNIIVVTFVCLLMSFAWSLFVGYNYVGTYREGLQYHGLGFSGPLVSGKEFLLSAGYAYTLLLAFAFLGFFMVDRDVFRKLMEVLVASGALVVLWPTPPEGRLTFLTFPAIIPLAAYGISQASAILADRPVFGKLNKKCWLVLIILAIIVLSNLLTRKLYFRLI